MLSFCSDHVGSFLSVDQDTPSFLLSGDLISLYLLVPDPTLEDEMARGDIRSPVESS